MTENGAEFLFTDRPSLETLPVEIILKVLHEVTDLDALYNLIRASPTASNIFDHNAHTIIEAVLSMCPLKIEIQNLFRAVILTRSSAPPFNNLHELKTLFDAWYFFTNPGYRRPFMPPSHSLKAASLRSIRSGLATACRISALTYTCLEFYLKRLHDKSIYDPYDCGPRNFTLNDFLKNTTHEWTRSVGEPIGGKYDGPPSWVEEMRVARALWRMQLVGEAQRLATRDPNRLGYSAEDINEIVRMTPEKFVTSEDVYYDGMVEETRTVCEYLRQLGGGNGEPSQNPLAEYYQLLCPPAIEARSWITQMPKPIKRKADFGEFYDLGNRLVPADPPIETLELLVKGPSPELLQAHQSWFIEHEPVDYADMVGWGTEWYLDLTNGLNSESPLLHVPFDAFRRLGIAIWNKERLRSMSLDGDDPSYHLTARGFFVWRSLLPEVQIAQAAHIIRKRMAHAGWPDRFT